MTTNNTTEKLKEVRAALSGAFTVLNASGDYFGKSTQRKLKDSVIIIDQLITEQEAAVVIKEPNYHYEAMRYGWECAVERMMEQIPDEPLYTAPQPAPAAVPEGWKSGIESVAKMLEKKADEYATQYGHDDMGSLSFGHGRGAEAMSDHHNTLCELAEEVRAMLAAAPTP